MRLATYVIFLIALGFSTMAAGAALSLHQLVVAALMGVVSFVLCGACWVMNALHAVLEVRLKEGLANAQRAEYQMEQVRMEMLQARRAAAKPDGEFQPQTHRPS